MTALAASLGCPHVDCPATFATRHAVVGHLVAAHDFTRVGALDATRGYAEPAGSGPVHITRFGDAAAADGKAPALERVATVQAAQGPVVTAPRPVPPIAGPRLCSVCSKPGHKAPKCPGLGALHAQDRRPVPERPGSLLGDARAALRVELGIAEDRVAKLREAIAALERLES